MAADDALWDVSPTREDELFPRSDLFAEDTGPLLTVWVSARGWARQDVRVKVDTIHEPRADLDSMAVLIRRLPRVEG